MEYKVTLADGSEKNYEENTLLLDICRDISEGLLRVCLGAVVNGEIKGLQEPLKEDSQIRFVKFEDEEGKEIFWHTSSHLMAYAIKNLYPGTKFAIGPSIENGFYYDLDTDHTFSPEELPKIEEEMLRLAKEGYELERIEISREEALKLFKDRGEIYKVELIEDLDEDETITLYKMGDFVDLCRGPHLLNTKKIKAVKLTSIAGAYWRGDEKNKMLQRIYGISFEKKGQLDKYLEDLEEAKKRDHRKIGKEMDLFSFQPEAPGFPFYHPKGMVIRNEIEDYWKELHRKKGYGEIRTPMILNEFLWHQSGHWDHYKENMYFTKIDGEDYAIKPMNCPGSILVYKNSMHSYREFPMRLCELGLVHRHELSGALHGMFRVRAFTQDDAHIFMLPNQIEDEILGVMKLADEIYKTFGFDYELELSTRPEDSMGSDEDWEMAINALKNALEKSNKPYRINEGDGAFYGPKIDFHLKDAMGKTWQCGTIQLDFQMPERFDLTYIDSDGEKKRPVMVHRAILGSIERFIGSITEKYAGKFPFWLSPDQVKIIPVSDKFNDYSYELKDQLFDLGYRVSVDDRAEKLGFKIREAQLNHVNYSLVIGEKEINENTLSVRSRDKGDLGSMTREDFLNMIREEKETKALEAK